MLNQHASLIVKWGNDISLEVRNAFNAFCDAVEEEIRDGQLLSDSSTRPSPWDKAYGRCQILMETHQG